MPDKDSPQRGPHGRRLPDRIGDGDSDQACWNKVEDCAKAPDGSAKQSEGMIGSGSAEIFSEPDGFALQRMLHQIDVEHEAAEERSEREEDRSRIGRERPRSSHGTRDK